MTMLMERRVEEAPTAADAAEPRHTFDQVLDLVARGALPRDRRLQLGFDQATGDYRLSVAVPT